MNSTDTKFAALRAAVMASSAKSVARITEYWQAHGIDARAEHDANGVISSRIDVRRHIPAPGSFAKGARS
ncbi:hypothetical protein [Hyphococcus sp.]|uniref:hypothetical protein n=1 Tax=Hyphococcus sp. TaxID=2038636 RepID=UPI00208635D5|nr:MAG: hypothetical protein DHS20C04_32340 [Marinicaulis sp.]